MDILRDFLRVIPPVTATLSALVVTTFIATKNGFLHPFWLAFDWDFILQGQLWRLITPFFVVSIDSVFFFFHILFMSAPPLLTPRVTLFSFIEQSKRSVAECLWFLLFLVVPIVAFECIASIVGWSHLVFGSFATLVNAAIEYYWSKCNFHGLFFPRLVPSLYNGVSFVRVHQFITHVLVNRTETHHQSF